MGVVTVDSVLPALGSSHIGLPRSLSLSMHYAQEVHPSNLAAEHQQQTESMILSVLWSQ